MSRPAAEQALRDQIVDLAVEIAKKAEVGDRARHGKVHVVVDSGSMSTLKALAGTLESIAQFAPAAPPPAAPAAPGPR